MLSLFTPDQTLGTSHELSSDHSADGAPCFTLIPPSHLPARRMIQGMGAESLLILVGLWMAWTFIPLPHASPNDVDPKKVVRIYYPRPAQRRVLVAPSTRAKGDKSRRLLSPPKSFRTALAPSLELPSVISAPLPLAVPAIGNGIPMPPAPAPTLPALPIREGVPKPLPVLDASSERGLPRGSSPVGRRANSPGDLLGSGGTATRAFGRGRDGGGPPDLAPSAPRVADRLRPQAQGAPFTKPSISFMPKPTYPRAALENRIEGDVSIEVTFDKDGHVIFRRFVRQLQNADLNSAARESVERIRFVPAMREGIPIDQASVVTVHFRFSRLDMPASF